MNKYFYPGICLVILLYTSHLPAQTRDDFSDGNFTTNPIWSGDDSLFRINTSFQLQSKGSSAGGEIALSTHCEIPVETEWRYWIRMAFNPSTQNFVRIYLCSDQAQLKGAMQGYYVQLGGSSGNTDSISLYRQNNTQKLCLIQGRAGTLGKSNNILQLLIKRKQNGEWRVYSDTNGTQNFQLEGMAIDTHQLVGSYTGMLFKYTSSNAQNFYFDQMYMGEPILDKSPPKLLQARVMDSTQIRLQFDETPALPQNQDIILSGQNWVDSIQIIQQEMVLQLLHPVISDTPITLQLNGIKDAYGNALDTQLIVYYHVLRPGDLLITEFMSDPDPVIGLPNAEYIEIYNTSKVPLILNQLKLKDAGSTGNIPECILAAKSFLLLCDPKDSILFQSYGQTIGVSGFPSLNNSGDLIALLDEKQKVLDQVNFDLSWYANKNKESGGWSIEMMNPLQTCKGKMNYQASKSATGGSPGKFNSEWILQPDLNGPQLLQMNPADNSKIQLQFDEPVFILGQADTCFKLNGIGIESVQQFENNRQTLVIYLKDSLRHMDNYELIWNGLFDCSGNAKSGTHLFTFIEARVPHQNELIMQEMYFDLNRKGNFPNHEFIEIFNKSAYAIQTKGFILRDGTGTYTLPEGIILPNEPALLCAIEYAPEFAAYGHILGMDHFPTLNNSDGITLRDSNGFILHQVNYSESWLTQTAKVFSCSIEMADTENPCAGKENWMASQDPTGASPGKRNSWQFKVSDKNPPSLNRVYVNNPESITLTFGENLDSMSLAGEENFSLGEGLVASNYHYVSDTLYKIRIHFRQPLDSAKTYQVHIQQAGDCVQFMNRDIVSPSFQIPQQAKKGELQFNEILCNPKPGGNDFIELLNTSEKTIDLSQLFLAGISENGERQEVVGIGKEGRMAYPGEYITLTEIPAALRHQYTMHNTYSLMENHTPVMNDEAGTVVLLNERDETLDSISYQSKMHIGFLNETEGISLEKINPHLPSWEYTNWTSAAEEFGYATPCSRNSQYRQAAVIGRFACVAPYFSPDGDGKEDLMTFVYHNPGDKSIGNLKVYDDSGRMVKTICRSKLLAPSGELHWNGEDETGQKAGIGNYLALFEYVEENGSSQQFRISFSLLSR